MSKLFPVLALILALFAVPPASASSPQLLCDNSNAGVVFCNVVGASGVQQYNWGASTGLNLRGVFSSTASFTCASSGASGQVRVNFTDSAGIRYFFSKPVVCLPCGPGGAP